VVQTISQPDIGQTFYVGKLSFATVNPNPFELLELYFFQPVTTFAGGLVSGDEIDENSVVSQWRYISAEALEPGCFVLLGLGAAVVFGRRSRLLIKTLIPTNVFSA
jgi:hypothetical protein